MESLSLTHHATLIRGEQGSALALLEEVLGVAFSHAPHPDVLFTRREQLSIDDVRELGRVATQRPIEHSMCTFVVAAEGIGSEAQNALLKLTEDPPRHARFVFILPLSAPILPTLRSRVVEHHIRTEVENRKDDFSALPLRDALRAIAQVTKEKDNAGMEDMLQSLEQYAHCEIEKRSSHNALLTARQYIETRGASPKMLLEHALLEAHEKPHAKLR
jgi:DNA polymerase-3 subunit delta'